MLHTPHATPALSPAAATYGAALSAGRAPGAGASPVDAMTSALESERRLVEELGAVMKRQRLAVSADDLQALDDSVFATHRVLQTLAEARKRRRAIVRLLGAADNLNLRDLEDALGPRMTPALAAARDALREAASGLSREVAVNRDVLREAMANGANYLQLLTGDAAAPAATYTQPTAAPQPPAPRGGLLVDRRA